MKSQNQSNAKSKRNRRKGHLALKSEKRKKKKTSKKMSGVKASDGPNQEASDGPNQEASDVPNTSLIVQHYELYEDPPPCKDKERIKFGKEYLLETSANLDDFDIVDEEQKQEGLRHLSLTSEQDLKIKQIYRERKLFLKSLPLLYVKEVGDEASLSVDSSVRYPLFYPDIEDLISLIQGKLQETRWIHIRKMGNLDNAIFISVEGLGLDDYNKADCPALSNFGCQTEFVSPLTYDDSVESCIASKLDPSSIDKPYLGFQSAVGSRDGFIAGLDSLFNINVNKTSVTLSSDGNIETLNHSNGTKRDVGIQNMLLTDRPKLSERDESTQGVKTAGGSDKSEVKKSKACTREKTILDEHLEKVSRRFDLHRNVLKRIVREKEECLEGEQVLPIAQYHRDNFSRLELVMTPRDMANERYPLPFKGSRYAHFARTKDEYAPVTDQSPMFGLDCEMCLTAAGNELTRISIVNEKHEVVYEKLVKPYNPIRNYLTKFSGITKQMLQDVTTRLPDVQQEVKRLLPPDAILVGQSLNGDLIAMQMMHPYVIDSGCVYNMTGRAKAKTKLKTLCAEFLSRAIQQENRLGHDSIEDSVATLELVQEKLKHNYIWGNKVLGYKRTEAESRAAHLKLLENEKKPVDPDAKARLAVNSKVDTPHLFAPPISKEKLLENINELEQVMKDPESWKPAKRKIEQDETSSYQQQIETPKSKKQKLETETVEEEVKEKLENSEKMAGKKKKSLVEEREDGGRKDGGEAKDSGIEDSHSDSDKLTESDRLLAMQNHLLPTSAADAKTWACERVTIIGSDEVIERYKTCLAEQHRGSIEFVSVENSRDVVKRIVVSDTQPGRQIIVAHLSSTSIKKVNKWCEELVSSVKSNDLVCVSLNGREKSNNKGAFFATVPGSANIPPVRQVIDQYLQSQGVVL